MVDCANGAYSGIAPTAFERLGAEVTAIGCEPDGTNINVGCGATDLSTLQQAVTSSGADLGVAFDGDGDRMLAVDARGEVVDGDQILAILMLHLGVDLVAVTVMANLGLHRLAEERGIRVVTTDVGDRYVLEALRRENGDPRRRAVGPPDLSARPRHRRRPCRGAPALRRARRPDARGGGGGDAAFPAGEGEHPRRRKELSETLREEVDRLNKRFDGHGRVLVRPSGTEPVIRVLAEAETAPEAEEACGTISALVRRELG